MSVIYVARITDAADFGSLMDEHAFTSRDRAQAWADARVGELEEEAQEREEPCEPRVSIDSLGFSEG